MFSMAGLILSIIAAKVNVAALMYFFLDLICIYGLNHEVKFFFPDATKWLQKDQVKTFHWKIAITVADLSQYYFPFYVSIKKENDCYY